MDIFRMLCEGAKAEFVFYFIEYYAYKDFIADFRVTRHNDKLFIHLSLCKL